MAFALRRQPEPQPAPTPARVGAGGRRPDAPLPGQPSRALEWLWPQLSHVPHPHVLECGRLRPVTMEVLVARGAKVYVADLVTVLRSNSPALWDRSGKVPVFRLPDLLVHLPSIPDGSLSAVFCWHLFDLIPRDAVSGLFDRLMRFLAPGGVLFCLVREPYLPAGADNDWWLETPTRLGSEAGKALFAYPPMTNRQVESLAPAGSVKTFLTRAGLREVVVLK